MLMVYDDEPHMPVDPDTTPGRGAAPPLAQNPCHGQRVPVYLCQTHGKQWPIASLHLELCPDLLLKSRVRSVVRKQLRPVHDKATGKTFLRQCSNTWAEDIRQLERGRVKRGVQTRKDADVQAEDRFMQWKNVVDDTFTLP